VVSSEKLIIRQQFEENKLSWKKSFLDGFSQDENGNPVPWMTYPAIEFLKKNLTKNHEVFEFGCGASTLFFAKIVKKVTGLETNKKWLEILDVMLNETKDLKKQFSNSTHEILRFAQDDNLKVEITLMEDGLTNNSYENFPKNCGQKFDLIIIDSLKRFDCAKNVIEALKQDGAIILDDSERSNYKKIFNFFSDCGFKKQDFFGIAPAQLRIKNTTIFTK
jgi:hypothetical protein